MDASKHRSSASIRGSANSTNRRADLDDVGDDDSFRSLSLADYDQGRVSNTQSRLGDAEVDDARSPDSYTPYRSNRRSKDSNNRSGKSPTIARSPGSDNRRRETDLSRQQNGVEPRLSLRSVEPATTTQQTRKTSSNIPLKLESPTKMGDGGWQEGKTVADCNRHMLARGIGCDVTFFVGEGLQQFKAHKYILVSRSSALYRLLQDRLHEADTTISVPDVKPDIFKIVLVYLYTGDIEWSLHVATALLHPAAKFGFRSLQRECFDYMVTELNSDNVCTILENAHKYNIPAIYEKCLYFTHINGADVLNSTAFRQLCKECVETIIRSDDLNADELLVYSGLMLWADEECRRRNMPPTDSNRRDVVGSALYGVRYPLIDVGVFADTISQNDVLSPDEKIILFQHYHGEISKLPAQFNRSPRRQYIVNERAIKIAQSQTYSNPVREFRPYNIPRLQLTEPIYESSYDDVTFMPDQSVSEGNKNQPILRVVRFRGIGEAWQLNGPDAIAFRCSADLRLRGVQIFGPSKSTDYYNVTLSVFDDRKAEVRQEKMTVVTDRSKVFDIVLKQPVTVPAGRLYTVQTLMKGKPTIRGTDGVSSISTEGVEFEFKTSNLSSNGTDISSGQIPSLLFSKV